MIPTAAWIERGPCSLCGSRSLQAERKIDVFPLERCSDCGFLQTGLVLRPDALAGYYTDGYGGVRQKQGQQINAMINWAAMQRMGLLDRPLEKVLDVGCGYGFLIHEFAGVARQPVGVELAQSEIDHARDVLDCTVASDISDLPAPLQNGFDLVVLFEVLEHITDPVAFLSGFAQRLRPGGVLVVGTDNFLSAPAKSLGDGFPKWIPHQHVSLFDPKSLESAIARVDGMQVIARCSYTPWELTARALLHRLSLGRIGARRFQLDAELAGENSRPFRLFALRRAVNRLWFSLSARRDLSGEMMFIAARKS